MSSRREAPTVLAVALAVLAFVTHFGHLTSGSGFDFYQFWMFGQAAHKSAAANLYSESERLRIGEAYYQQALAAPASPRHMRMAEQRREAQAISSPLLYTCFGLVSRGMFERDFFDYQIFTSLCAAGAILLLGRVFRYPWIAVALWMCLLLMWVGPFMSDVEVGNVNRIQLFSVALFLWLQTRGNVWARDLLGGIVLSTMITFKPNLALVPVLLVITWLIDAQWARLGRSVAGVVLGAAAAVALSGWYFGGAACWMHWLEAVDATRRSMQTHGVGNFSLAWTLTQRFGLDAALPMTAALCAVTLIAIGVGRSRRPSLARDAAITAVAIGIALLAAPLTWYHYFLLATPLWMMTLQPDARHRSLHQIVAVLVLIGFAFDHLVRDFVAGMQAMHISSAVLWVCVSLPMLVALVTIARPGQNEGETP